MTADNPLARHTVAIKEITSAIEACRAKIAKSTPT